MKHKVNVLAVCMGVAIVITIIFIPLLIASLAEQTRLRQTTQSLLDLEAGKLFCLQDAQVHGGNCVLEDEGNGTLVWYREPVEWSEV